MTAFLIVLIAILVICCGVTLYLYFSVRKEADLAEHMYMHYSELYNESREKYVCEHGKSKSKICELEDALYEKNKQIKMLRSMIDERTINVRTFGTRTDYFNGSINIPDEILQAESVIDAPNAPIFDFEIRDKLVRMLGKEVLKHTGFKMQYDLFHHVNKLVYICPIVVENKRCDNGEFIYPDQEAEMPMIDIIKKLYEKDKEVEL